MDLFLGLLMLLAVFLGGCRLGQWVGRQEGRVAGYEEGAEDAVRVVASW
jgi:hypothetical protein